MNQFTDFPFNVNNLRNIAATSTSRSTLEQLQYMAIITAEKKLKIHQKVFVNACK
jgi:hypothetical protein